MKGDKGSNPSSGSVSRYIPPHLRGNNNLAAEELSSSSSNRGDKDSRYSDYRDSRDYRNDSRGDFRDNKDYRGNG